MFNGTYRRRPLPVFQPASMPKNKGQLRIVEAELILYACPSGELAGQIARYFAAAKEGFSWNPAHNYMPHCSLTGFFHDAPPAISEYVAVMKGLLAGREACTRMPVLRVKEMVLRKDFHGLSLSSDWLLRLVADFAAAAPAATRTDALRLKHWLHLSLAYRFPEAEHESLAELARRTVNAQAPVTWTLYLYQRHRDHRWSQHGQWPLDRIEEKVACI